MVSGFGVPSGFRLFQSTPGRLGANAWSICAKLRAAAVHAFVQIDHERPGAIAARTARRSGTRRAGGEVIRVRLELLAHLVALRLDALGVFRADADRLAIFSSLLHRDRTPQLAQVGRLAGAKCLVVWSGKDQRRRAQVVVDERDEAVAFLGDS